MTNTLKATSIRAAKAWSGDSDDAWGTRPDGDTWSVTYLLQCRLGDGEWEWVVPAGADPIDEGDSLYGSTSLRGPSLGRATMPTSSLPTCLHAMRAVPRTAIVWSNAFPVLTMFRTRMLLIQWPPRRWVI